jgi:hypothetical protein
MIWREARRQPDEEAVDEEEVVEEVVMEEEDVVVEDVVVEEAGVGVVARERLAVRSKESSICQSVRSLASCACIRSPSGSCKAMRTEVTVGRGGSSGARV